MYHNGHFPISWWTDGGRLPTIGPTDGQMMGHTGVPHSGCRIRSWFGKWTDGGRLPTIGPTDGQMIGQLSEDGVPHSEMPNPELVWKVTVWCVCTPR